MEQNIRNKGKTLFSFLQYNMQITFANKFVYFVLFAVLFFIAILLINLFNHHIPREQNFYFILIVPAIALILHPTAFGVQSEKDNRSLEVLFGIPDYRYKVWLIRLFMVFFVSWFILLILGAISHYLITDIRYFNMAFQLMFPTVFCGTYAFMFSSVLKSGTGAAVLLIITILVFFIFGEALDGETYYLYFNPYEKPGNMSPELWQKTILENRAYMSGLSIVFLLIGLFNLQKREGFLK